MVLCDYYNIKLDNGKLAKEKEEDLIFNTEDNLITEDIDNNENIIKEDNSDIEKVIDTSEAQDSPDKPSELKVAEDVTKNVAMLDLIKELIKDELDAVQNYNNAIAASLNTGYDKFVPTFASLVSEEMVHIGELQKLQNLLQPNTISDLQDGQEEAQKDLAET